MKAFILSFSLFLSFFSLNAQLNEIWHRSYNGQGDFSDAFTCVTSDLQGNTYVGGYTDRTGENSNFLVAKYNSSGKLLWYKSWNGTGNGPDQANKIVFSNNRIYAAGFVNSSVVGHDFFLIALSADGDSIWAKTYNDAAFNQYDIANDMVINSNGDIVLTGQSDRDPTNIGNDDYLTVSYNSNGTFLWAKRYNGIGNAIDRATGIVADGLGNIIITGRSDNGNDDDYVTIKYASNGTQLWARTLNNGGNDRAEDLDVDSKGNCYVIGRSSNGTNNDMRTVKYSAAGQQLFSVAYDYIEDDRGDLIDVAADGSFVIGGRSDISIGLLVNYDAVIVKYSITGAPVWTKMYGNPQKTDDNISGLNLLDDGRVLICGSAVQSISTPDLFNEFVAMYASAGNNLWVYTYAGNPNFDDQAKACIYYSAQLFGVVGFSEGPNQQSNANVLWINDAGALVQSASFDGIGDNRENIRKMIQDKNGNIYLSGYAVNKFRDRDILLAKLNSLGDTIWTRSISGTLNGSDDEASGLLLDQQGNICISGSVKNSGSSSDIMLLKFDPNGTLLWQATYDSPFSESDRSFDMTVDAADNLFVTGKSDINNSPLVLDDEIITIKYNSAGVRQWVSTYKGSSGIDRGRIIKTLSNGNVNVVGWIRNIDHDDLIVIQYNTAGTEVWHQITSGPFKGNFNPRDAILDANGNLIVTGNIVSVADSLVQVGFAASFASSGIRNWIQYFNNSNHHTTIESIEMDQAGQIYVSGTSDAASKNQSPMILRLNPKDGSLIWEKYLSSFTSEYHATDDALLTNTGSLWLISHYDADISANNVKFNTLISKIETNTGNVLGHTVVNYSDSITVLNTAITDQNAIIGGGSIWMDKTQRDLFIGKWDLTTMIPQQTLHEKVQIFPNPVSKTISIHLEEKQLGSEYFVYDQEGKMVMSGRITLPHMLLSVDHLSSGIYFFQTRELGLIRFLKN